MVQRKSSRTKRDYENLQTRNGSLFMQLARGRPFSLSASGQFASLGDMEQAWSDNRDQVQSWWKTNMPPGTRCYAAWLFDILPKLRLPYIMPELPYETKADFPKHFPPIDGPEHVFLFEHKLIDAAEYNAAVIYTKEKQLSVCCR
jgi:hypothetical protein